MNVACCVYTGGIVVLSFLVWNISSFKDHHLFSFDLFPSPSFNVLCAYLMSCDITVHLVFIFCLAWFSLSVCLFCDTIWFLYDYRLSRMYTSMLGTLGYSYCAGSESQWKQARPFWDPKLKSNISNILTYSNVDAVLTWFSHKLSDMRYHCSCLEKSNVSLSVIETGFPGPGSRWVSMPWQRLSVSIFLCS